MKIFKYLLLILTLNLNADTINVVIDGAGCTADKIIFKGNPVNNIKVKYPCVVNTSTANVAPLAIAVSGSYEENSTAYLYSTGSNDSDGTISSYLWRQKGTTCSLVSLSNSDQATANFVTPTSGQTCKFSLLIVDNDGSQDMAIATITTTPSTGQAPPVAVAPGDFSATELTSVNLDGSTSAGTDSAIVSYSWLQTAGTPTITLTGETTDTASFTAPAVVSSTPYTFDLQVTDGNANTDNDSVIVTVNPVPPSYPYEPSADSRLIYVSDTGNDGTCSEMTLAEVTDPFDPQVAVDDCLTLSAAIAKMRDGYPDWILLKRGDVWTDEDFGSNFNLSGRSSTEPLLITYYGTSGARPLIQPSGTGLNTGGAVTNYVTMYGLEWYSRKRDPNNGEYVSSPSGGTGLRFVGGGANIVIDDTKVHFFANNLNIQSWGGGIISEFTLKRSIIANSYTHQGQSYSQGVFMDKLDGILIEENVFDNNGWNADIPEAHRIQHNHNLYIQAWQDGDKIIVSYNISSRSSSTGIHGRPGGLYQDNLFIENPVNLQFGYRDNAIRDNVLAHSLDNVILEGIRMHEAGTNPDTTTALWGIEIKDDALDCTGCAITIENTIVANVNQAAGSNYIGIRSRANVTYTNNTTHKWPTSAATGSHPDAGIPAYMATLGQTQTLEAFMTIVKNRPLGTWDTDYSAQVVNNYIRAGFD